MCEAKPISAVGGRHIRHNYTIERAMVQNPPGYRMFAGFDPHYLGPGHTRIMGIPGQRECPGRGYTYGKSRL
jgi:hypothetical protein